MNFLHIGIAHEGPVAIVTLNRPQRRNALSLELMLELLDCLDQLGRNHLLARQPVPPPALMGMNRRAMIRSLGIAAAFAVPVVTSIVAPTPVQAATCTPQGGACVDSSTCCAGLTCQTNTCQP